MARQRERQPEWLTAANPDVLTAIVWPNRVWLYQAAPPPLPAALRRRLRLYGCGCARMVWRVLPTDAISAVVLSERFAEGRATHSSLRAAAVRMVTNPLSYQQQATNAAGWASYGDLAHPADQDPLLWDPTEAARCAAKALAIRAAGKAPPGRPTTPEWETAWNDAFAAARAHQAELLRDIFPPPGYAPRVEPDWLTSTVVALAQQMDATGDFGAVPILADALQDAGCEDAVMLDRCRAPSGIHSRGNWVVDLVLGRA